MILVFIPAWTTPVGGVTADSPGSVAVHIEDPVSACRE
ncbi:hypothetical protein GLA29479_2373 [Lysobacter antibioticus]|uniref:Uncharacterized protein n=1 Tax=Lysobacter antibioticus TaxID=84531 RepID=A0A0S2FD72_LYSAN|nr:hypothetical protein GLA29479_2373 [Lysobacter antibioticus]ALN81466.1 hypothetical protein LA76x_3340 [Lysobacter antibioticus]